MLLVFILIFQINFVYSADYNYRDVLGKSLLYYEAQRSGKLPSQNRIPWRKDSFLNDRGTNGEDLTGGYFDGGGYMKFTFPMAFTTTVLGWGLLDFHNGYILADQLNNGLSALKWATDYLMKAHPIGKDILYVAIGSLEDEHLYWGRPEDWPPSKIRPAYQINATSPGTDVAAEVAAAFAVASMVFKNFNNNTNPKYMDVDISYSLLCLAHAKELYNFANKTRRKYSDSVPMVQQDYNSWTGFGDELGWAAAWLYRASKDSVYLSDFHSHWNTFKLHEKPLQFSWDWKTAGLQALMAKMFPSNDRYSDIIKEFCDWAIFTADRTPKKLLFPKANEIDGVLRQAANTAFVCIVAATAGNSNRTYIRFAQSQIDYILGDSGRSFVVGFGNNPPKYVFHRASSCRSQPDPCDWSDYLKLTPNSNELTGALVGGPDNKDAYGDSRYNQNQNEVNLDFNAGFQSTLAALAYFKSQGLLAF